MDDLTGILARDFGFRQSRSAPMSSIKASGNTAAAAPRSAAPKRYSASPAPPPPPPNSILDGFGGPAPKPVYDDVFFDTLTGAKNPSSDVYDDFFPTMQSASQADSRRSSSPPYHDLLGDLGTNQSGSVFNDGFLDKLGRAAPEPKVSEIGSAGFDELIPGFGDAVSATNPNSDRPQKPLGNKGESADDFSWVSAEDVGLFTPLSTAPPPTRLAPPPEPFLQSRQSSGMSQIDELENFAMGKPKKHANGRDGVGNGKESFDIFSGTESYRKGEFDVSQRTSNDVADDVDLMFGATAGRKSGNFDEAQRKSANTADDIDLMFGATASRSNDALRVPTNVADDMDLMFGAATSRSNEAQRTSTNAVDDMDFMFGATAYGKSGQFNNTQKTAGTMVDDMDFMFGAPTGKKSGQYNEAQRTSRTVVDDMDFMFGAPSGRMSVEFEEIEGESEERRRARLERHQRTRERMDNALADKKARELEAQMEQEERGNIAEALDGKIKQWAAGKEGNLRALLSSLQLVLWSGCGWQPVSLTDLITGASVKKVYNKAKLCVHPDKVQQKGATLEQKYIAEKVFDILQEAWRKFSAQEGV